jgi:hypothetical protein
MTKTIVGFVALAALFGACSDGDTCWVGDHRYKVGASFPSNDGCNTCTCESNGTVACTLMGCLSDAGYERPDLRPKFDVPAYLDATADQGSAPADAKPGADRVDAGPADVPPVDAPLVDAGSVDAFESWGLDGRRGDVALVDGTQIDTGRLDTGRIDTTSSEAGTSCALATSIRFGSNGGLVISQDDYRLDPPAAMTITRTYYYSSADAGVRTCAPTLPACGASGVVSLSNIVADLADSDVQAALAASTPPLFGRDTRPMDGTVYQVALGSGGSMLVGWACASGSSSPCTTIPAGVQRLVDDLRSLATAMAAQPACSGL